jgi:hypothetical protein
MLLLFRDMMLGHNYASSREQVRTGALIHTAVGSMRSPCGHVGPFYLATEVDQLEMMTSELNACAISRRYDEMIETLYHSTRRSIETVPCYRLNDFGQILLRPAFTFLRWRAMSKALGASTTEPTGPKRHSRAGRNRLRHGPTCGPSLSSSGASWVTRDDRRRSERGRWETAGLSSRKICWDRHGGQLRW